jgi:hypothetical protein
MQKPAGWAAVWSPLAQPACLLGGSDINDHPWTAVESSLTDVRAVSVRGGQPNPTGIDPDSALSPCPATDSSPSRTRVAAGPHIAPVNQDHQLRPTQRRAHRRVSPQRAGGFAFNRGDAFFGAAVHQRDLAPQLPCARFRHRLTHLATVPLALPDALRDPPTSKN